jgi:hypothetical protein
MSLEREIDLHLDGEGFDSIDGGGQNTDQHGRIVGEGGRKGNEVFLGCGAGGVHFTFLGDSCRGRSDSRPRAFPFN